MDKKNSDAKIAANRRYDTKTYKYYSLRLRYEDDADIIDDLEQAKREGIPVREWIRKYFDKE